MNLARWHAAIAFSFIAAAATAWGQAPAAATDPQPAEIKTPGAAQDARPAEIKTPGEAEDPLQLVGAKMRESQAMLAAANPGPLTQEVQKDIVADLDRLIAQARKTAKRSSGKDSAKSTSRAPLGSMPKPDAEGKTPGETPAAKSDDRKTSTPGKQDDAARALDGMKRIWGTLPPREREKVLELKAEDFVPKYRAMIEEYYRRLATGE